MLLLFVLQSEKSKLYIFQKCRCLKKPYLQVLQLKKKICLVHGKIAQHIILQWVESKIREKYVPIMNV